ncbi:hypothetical protein GHT06_010964 [Daphnia sinensis]|uniref:Platelet-derived growth factor (PDGF) family profile domain-containing protein n=1 Tax=Daphnia sinensis TaxID=1820382 RepID=A0AAD5LIU5_9CRUS|nr:hypothetical protein GHT06_010964 [Daphnia sinensis]
MPYASMNQCIKVIFVVLIIHDSAIFLSGANSIAPVTKQPFNERNCKRPQSRIAYLEDEYADYNSAAIYLPHAAIVQRCDNSIGCCKKGHRYVSTKEEKVTFHFQEFLHGNKTKKEVLLTNHLHCECHSLSKHE